VSDFFANLAARAVEASATIRPRVATRFEPLAPPESFTEVVIETAGAETGALTPIASVAEKARSPAESEPAFVPVAPPSEAASAIPVGSVASPIVAPPSAATLPQPSTRDVPSAPEPSVGLRHDRAAPPSAATLLQPSARDVPSVPEPSVAPPPDDRAAIEPVLLRTHHASPPTTPAFPLVVPPSLPREIGTTLAPRLAAVERPEPPRVETIVHVNIGRIELRAPPPPATKRERAVPAVTTLAEYLQQRAARTRT
jgi:hypothetical protein